MDGYKLGRDRQGRRGVCVAFYVRESFDVVEFAAVDDKVESLWVRIRGAPTRWTSWWRSVIDNLTRIKRQMRRSMNSWQKLHDLQPLFL